MGIIDKNPELITLITFLIKNSLAISSSTDPNRLGELLASSMEHIVAQLIADNVIEESPAYSLDELRTIGLHTLDYIYERATLSKKVVLTQLIKSLRTEFSNKFVNEAQEVLTSIKQKFENLFDEDTPPSKAQDELLSILECVSVNTPASKKMHIVMTGSRLDETATKKDYEKIIRGLASSLSIKAPKEAVFDWDVKNQKFLPQTAVILVGSPTAELLNRTTAAHPELLKNKIPLESVITQTILPRAEPESLILSLTSLPIVSNKHFRNINAIGTITPVLLLRARENEEQKFEVSEWKPESEEDLENMEATSAVCITLWPKSTGNAFFGMFTFERTIDGVVYHEIEVDNTMLIGEAPSTVAKIGEVAWSVIDRMRVDEEYTNRIMRSAYVKSLGDALKLVI